MLCQVTWGFVCFSLNIKIIIEHVGFGIRCVISSVPPKVEGVFGNSFS